MTPVLTVVIPAHNPDPERLRETLHGLRKQTLDGSLWETLLVDNSSTRFPNKEWLAEHAPARFRILQEATLGLSAARRSALQVAVGDFVVLVDDDNVLEPDYLLQTLAIFSTHPRVGLAGGRSSPRFDVEPPGWTREFFPLLALRDLGADERVSTGLLPAGAERNQYPVFAPIGAGMALRRQAWECWLATPAVGISDRRGAHLSSSGDNDIVLCAMRAGWEVGYFPKLALTHLIPPSRLEPEYLALLNNGIQRSWMQVLERHKVTPWPPLSAGGAALRKIKAWFTYRAWSSPSAHIRWRGACGHFDGRVAA